MQEINNEEFNKRRKMLGEVRYIQKLIEIDIEELNELTLQEKELKITNYDVKEVKSSVSNTNSQIEKIHDIIDLKEEIKISLDLLIKAKLRVRRLIRTVEDKRCRLYMHYRYYDCLGDETIKEKMDNISERTCNRLNKKGILTLVI